MKKKFDKEVRLVLKYIEDNATKYNPWVVITHRQVPKITGASPYYTNAIFDQLKLLNNITYRTEPSYPSSRKPLKFKIIEPQEKPENVFNEENYSSISERNMALLKERLTTQDTLQIGPMLKIMNYLYGKKADQSSVIIRSEDLSSVLAIEEEELKENLLILENAGVIEHEYTNIEDQEMDIKIVLSTKSAENKVKNIRPVSEKTEEPSDTTEAEGSKENYEDLIQNMQKFESFIGDFKEFINRKTNTVVDRVNNIEESRRTISKLLEERKEIQNEMDKIKEENKALKKENQQLIDYREKFEQNAQESLEIMLAVITNAVSEYVRIPAWDKDEKTNAKLQREVSKAVTDTMNEIIKQ